MVLSIWFTPGLIIWFLRTYLALELRIKEAFKSFTANISTMFKCQDWVCTKCSCRARPGSSRFCKCFLKSKMKFSLSSWENVTSPLEVLHNASWEEALCRTLILSSLLHHRAELWCWKMVICISTGSQDDKTGDLLCFWVKKGWIIWLLFLCSEWFGHPFFPSTL